MSSLFYINYSNRTGEDKWFVKRVGGLDKDGNAIIFGEFKTKAEANEFIKKEDEILLNNNSEGRIVKVVVKMDWGGCG